MNARLPINVNKQRLLTLFFPCKDGPKAELLIESLVAEEELSRDFTYTATVLCLDSNLSMRELQAKLINIELLDQDLGVRHFSGHCFEFRLLEMKSGYAVYQMVLKPWLAFLHLRVDHYLFRKQTVLQQTKTLLADYGMASWDYQIHGPDAEMTNACQYGESDHNYLHRRWEARGWLYWYEHGADRHKLILSDNSVLAPNIDSSSPVIEFHHDGGSNTDDRIHAWMPVRRIVPNRVALTSFDFKTPTPKRTGDRGAMLQGELPKLEVYEYRGVYGFKDDAQGKALATQRIEELESTGKYYEAHSNHRRVQPGRCFTLDSNQTVQHSSLKNEYLIIKVRHVIHNNLLNNEGASATYSNEFTCVRRVVPWRPGRGYASTEPKAYGIDTAIVTGLKGEEIYTDEYGRVKLQFHWDREGQHDADSSAWVRVATNWAGSQFGAISIPRVNTEVLVQYLQGNPDHPIVTGRVYNHRTMPPWSLPANQTQSGILTRSSKGAHYGNANAIRFEDKKGAEQLWLQAERNMEVHVEHDDLQTVGNDRVIKVAGNHAENIVKNMILKVDANLLETVKQDMTLEVSEGSQKNTIKGNISTTSLAGNISVDAKAGEIVITASTRITLKVGASSITMDGSNITLQSPGIDLNPQ